MAEHEARLTFAAHKLETVLVHVQKIMEKMVVIFGGTGIDNTPGSDYRQVELQGACELHRRKGTCNTRSTGEDDAKCWRTISIQKEDNFGSSNVDNAVCLPNIVEGTLREDDRENTVLGVSLKCD